MKHRDHSYTDLQFSSRYGQEFTVQSPPPADWHCQPLRTGGQRPTAARSSAPSAGGSFRPTLPAPAADPAAQAPSPQSRKSRKAGAGSGASKAFWRPFRRAAQPCSPQQRAGTGHLTAAGGPEEETRHRHPRTAPVGGAHSRLSVPLSSLLRGGGSACAVGPAAPKVWGHVGRGVGQPWGRLILQTLRESRRVRPLTPRPRHGSRRDPQRQDSLRVRTSGPPARRSRHAPGRCAGRGMSVGSRGGFYPAG